MPDPHAVAKVRARQLLEQLESLLRAMHATGAGVSRADIELVARLTHRLSWCSHSYSRRRSIALLAWILRQVGELLIRVVETTSCKQCASTQVRWRIDHDVWRGRQAIAGRGRDLAKGFRGAPGY